MDVFRFRDSTIVCVKIRARSGLGSKGKSEIGLGSNRAMARVWWGSGTGLGSSDPQSPFT